MRIFFSIVLVFTVLLLISCSGKSTLGPPVIQADFKRADRALVKGLRVVGEGLNDLNKEEMASVAALVAMTHVATVMEGQGMTGQVMIGFRAELPELCPPLPENTFKRFGDCRDHEADYATGMAKCLVEGKSESVCEKENYGSLQMAAQCRMEQIEALKDFIRFIPGRNWPDPPFPWPEDPHP